jgi:hypothetical protein
MAMTDSSSYLWVGLTYLSHGKTFAQQLNLLEELENEAAKTWKRVNT